MYKSIEIISYPAGTPYEDILEELFAALEEANKQSPEKPEAPRPKDPPAEVPNPPSKEELKLVAAYKALKNTLNEMYDLKKLILNGCGYDAWDKAGRIIDALEKVI